MSPLAHAILFCPSTVLAVGTGGRTVFLWENRREAAHSEAEAATVTVQDFLEFENIMSHSVEDRQTPSSAVCRGLVVDTLRASYRNNCSRSPFNRADTIRVHHDSSA